MTGRAVRPPLRVPLSRPVSSGSGVLGGRYQLGELLGVGGVAKVYRARDLQLHRDVAVKVFGAGIDPQSAERERAEVRTLAQLSHPNLVTLHDAGADRSQVPPRAYLVMALVDGQSLAQRLESGPLPAAQVRALGAQVADALAYVHSRGVVHRDVKPANILLDRSGRPYLTDFGIARAVGAAALTAVGDTVGTAAYLSPEQVRGQEVGPPTDVYALGLVLLEALTGVREYPGTTAETALARLTRPPRIDDAVPEELRALLRAMTASEPSARPTSEQVAERLGADPAATQLMTLSPEVPVDGTRVLTTALPAFDEPRPVASPWVARGRKVAGEAWDRALPWARARRDVIVAALAVLALLVVVLTVRASSGPGSEGSPQPSGTPGPSRLAPDLERLQELVQP